MAWHVPLYHALVHSAVAGFAMLAIATAALAVVREPARRIRIIEAVLAGLLLLPAVALIPGYPRLALWPASAPPQALRLAQPAPQTAPGAPTAVPASRTGDAKAPSLPTVASPAPRTPSATVPVPRVPRSAAATLGWALPVDARLAMVVAYLGLLSAWVAWSLVGLAAAARLIRSARPADDDCRAALRAVSGPAGDRVALCVSARVRQPLALAGWRAVIVLPEWLVDGGDAQQLRWALAHEWSHVARGDVYRWPAAGVVRWLYAYQPLVWHLRRQLRLCQDYLADAAAARAGIAAEDYAEFLTQLSTRHVRPPLSVGLGILSPPSDLCRRIIMLVDRRPLEASSPRHWNLLVLGSALVVVAAVACLGGAPPAAIATAADLSKNQTDAKEPSPAASTPADDPLLRQMRQQIAMLGDHLRALTDEPSSAQRDALIRRLEKEIRQLEEDLAERLAKIGPKLAAIARQAADTAVPAGSTGRLGESTTVVPHRDPFEAQAAPPFNGHIRPGDRLKFELAGGFPEDGNAPARQPTVEPDGSLPLGALYGRVQIAGKTLIEAEAIIQEHLKKTLRDPVVQLTYAGHDPDVVPAEQLGILGIQTPDSDVSTRVRQLEQELFELKNRIHDLHNKP